MLLNSKYCSMQNTVECHSMHESTKHDVHTQTIQKYVNNMSSNLSRTSQVRPTLCTSVQESAV